MKTSVHQQVAQGVAHRIAHRIAKAVADFLYLWRKPTSPGTVQAMEFLGELDDMARSSPADVDVIAHSICDDIRMRGVPHSFVAPTWKREGATMLADCTASAVHEAGCVEVDHVAVIRAVVFREADGRERLAVLYSPRFAAS